MSIRSAFPVKDAVKGASFYSAGDAGRASVSTGDARPRSIRG